MVAVIACTSAGTALAQQGGRPVSLIRDTEIEEILHRQSDPVFRQAGLVPQNVEIVLVNDRELNAFVSGGQNIFLNTGLILKTKDFNQLMGVIAHETGHIQLAHLARAREGMRSAVATQMMVLGLGLVAAMTSPDPGAAAGIFYSADYFATMQLFTYTRTQEAAADQAASQLLEKSGMSGKGLVDFFNNFRYQEVFDEARRDAYFRSHPLSSNRIKDLERDVQAAAHFSTQDSEATKLDHAVMVAKLRAFINYPQQTYNDYPETDTSYPARYARAIAYYKDTDLNKSISALDDLLKEQPENPYLWELKGQILFENGRIAEAEAPQRKAVELRPDAPLFRVSLGQTLVNLNNYEKALEAIPHLQRGLAIEEENPLGWRFLAEAYQRTDQPGLARLASAEQSYNLGQMANAREFGMRAKEMLQAGTPEYRRANDIVQAAEGIVVNQRRGG